MLQIPISRWGEPYDSLEKDKVVHFATGEVLAEVSRANGGLVERDMKHAARARKVLQEIPIRKLLELVKKAGELYATATLPLGNGTQSPDEFEPQRSLGMDFLIAPDQPAHPILGHYSVATNGL